MRHKMAKFEASRVGQYAGPYGVSAALVGQMFSTAGSVGGMAASSGLSVQAARIAAKPVPAAKAPPPVVERELSPELQEKARRAVWWNVGGIGLAVAVVGAAFWFTRKK